MTPSALPLSPVSVTTITVILPVLALFAFTLRAFDRRRKVVPASWDDWILGVGVLFLWSLAAICFIGVAIGALGRHSRPPDVHDKPGNTIHRDGTDVQAAKVVRAFSVLEKVTFCLIKSSVVLSYRRIFIKPIIRTATTALLVLFVAQTLAFAVAAAMQCNVRAWDAWYEAWTIRKHCTSAILLWVGYSIVDVVTDLVLLCLPIPLVLRLQMKRNKQFATIGIFILGSLSTAVGIARMGYLIHFAWSGGKGYRDLLGVQTTALVWSIIEASVAVIAASIPSIRRLLMDFVFKPHERSWMLPSGRNQDGSDSKGQETKYELGSLG